MTPAEFAATYLSEAQAVGHGTGIDPYVLLAQWGVETGWGSAVNNQNNLANIRCLADVPCIGGFAQFPSPDSFLVNCIATWHNGFYAAVLAARNASDQLRAIGESPWSANHYGNPPGAELVIAYNLIGGDMTPEEHDALMAIHDSWLKRTPNPSGPSASLLDTWITLRGEVADIQAKVTALAAGGIPPADLKPVLDAIAVLQTKLNSLTLKAV